MADETPAPLSDAEIAAIRERMDPARRGPWEDIPRLLATLAVYSELRGQALEDIARLAEERDAARRTLAALERDNAAMREIVAAVAHGWSNALGTRVGETAADGLALKARARALLAGMQTPTTGEAAENGEA